MSLPENSNRPPQDTAVELLRSIRDDQRQLLAEQRAFRRVFETFAAAYLNARFPFGKPLDRWQR